MEAKAIKKALKKFGRQMWELFKISIPTTFMFFCAGTILMMLTLQGETPDWTSKDVVWTVVCIIGGSAYAALLAWANGGSHYEMLVSGNMKRMSEDALDGGFKISSHKEAKEYRVWKGFAIGAFTAIFTLVIGILFGAFQGKIDSSEPGKGVAALTLIGFLTSGWSVIPMYLMNMNGIAINYYLSCLFALIPIAVSGGFYIGGAYARRAKRLREQLIAEQALKAEEQKVKKINYGGLPGTKPKKRK